MSHPAPLDWSLGELQVLATKAARGAGRSHGLGEEAGYATRWLAARGYDGAGLLADLLEATDGQTHDLIAPDEGLLAVRDAPICSIVLGTYLSDTGHVPEGAFGPVHCPMLLLPFLEVAEGEALRLTCGAAGIVLGAGGSVEGAALPSAAARITFAPASTPPPPGARAARARVAPEIRDRLERFAQRTYAPATEDSRARGAGAGTVDTD